MWKKSARSNGNGGNNCVEVNMSAATNQVLVRDSKDRNGPALVFTVDEWKAFIGGVKDEEFDI